MDNVNIQDFCEEHYDDILPIIMDKVRRDKRKESSCQNGLQRSSEKSEWQERVLKIQVPASHHRRRSVIRTAQRYTITKLGQVLDRAGQALEILSALEVAPPVETVPDTETASATLKSRTMVSTPKGLGPSTEDPLEADVDPGARRDRGKANLHHLADLKAATSDTGHWKSRDKRRKTLEEDLAVPWSCEDVDPFTPRIRNFRSSRKTRMPL
ncbi:hypothetical protein Tco_0458062 [Tanacetum coccineum]